jgi:hypothetical protein
LLNRIRLSVFRYSIQDIPKENMNEIRKELSIYCLGTI